VERKDVDSMCLRFSMVLHYACGFCHNTDIINFWIPRLCIFILGYLAYSHFEYFVLDKVKMMAKNKEKQKLVTLGEKVWFITII